MNSLIGWFARGMVWVVVAAAATSVAAQSVSITSGVPVTETFDSMAGVQNTTSDVLPPGWSLFESGTGTPDTTYLIDDGTSQSGNTFSYGISGDTDRAFGLLASGSVVGRIGAQLQNNTGANLTDLLIEYTGEQWRQGKPADADKLDFQYCLTTCALLDAANASNWTDFDALDLTAPVTNLAEGTKMDGNLPANRVSTSATISGLSLANGAQLWIRWMDINDGGVDDALAIEDFRVGLAVDNPPIVANTVPDNGASGVAVSSNIIVTFSEAVTANANAFTIACPSDANVAFAISGTGATRTLNPNADFAFNETCTATVIAANVSDLDGGSFDQMVANYSWTFTTVADIAPTILSTMPAANAMGVNVNAVVVINFSEPVNPTIPWITLTCGGDVYNGTLLGSNGDATWTLDPFTNFNNGDVCVVQITGANVVDVDGLPNALAGNTTFSFTVAPDVAPSVISTYPLHLDVNVPAASNLTVVFSEPVTVAPGAFAINCDVSLSHTFVQTDTALTQYTLNPDIDFTDAENCTFDITASLVTDIDGNADPLAANVRIEFTIGIGIVGYYERVDTSSCRALRATLHGVIDDHSAVFYSDTGNSWTPGDPSTYDVWEVLNLADEDPLDTSKILDVYKNESYTKIDGGTGIYNREHVWPNSQGFNNQQTLDGFPYSPYTDTQMLMASNTAYNSNRGSRVFDTCNPAIKATCTRDDTIANASNGAGGGPTAYSSPPGHNWYTAGQDGNSGSYEPWSFRRGDLARAMLYFDVRYEGGINTRNFQREPQLILTDNRSLIQISNNVLTPSYSGLLTPLLAWHNGDAPTPREGLRNAMVESVQGNRNPFVDHPEWADMLFAGACTGPDFVAVDDDYFGTEDTLMDRTQSHNGVADPGVLNDDRVFAGGPLSVATTPVVAPQHGVLSLNANGQFTYMPAANYCGKDSFTYSVSNGSLTDTAIMYLDIACVNDLPATVGSISNVSINAGAALNVITATAFSDADGDALVYSVTSTPALPASLSINAASGVISGTPIAADAGVYTVIVRATEPAPLTGFVTQTFTLTINADSAALFGNGFE